MDLIGSGAVKVPVKSYERWTLSIIAMFKPLAWRSYVIDSRHESLGIENFFDFSTFGYFFHDCFHKKHLSRFSKVAYLEQTCRY